MYTIDILENGQSEPLSRHFLAADYGRDRVLAYAWSRAEKHPGRTVVVRLQTQTLYVLQTTARRAKPRRRLDAVPAGELASSITGEVRRCSNAVPAGELASPLTGSDKAA